MLRTVHRAFSMKFLIAGAGGQIGTEMMPYLERAYGIDSVVASDIKPCEFPTQKQPEFVHLNVLDTEEYDKVVKKHNITHIIHLSALLSATAEMNYK